MALNMTLRTLLLLLVVVLVLVVLVSGFPPLPLPKDCRLLLLVVYVSSPQAALPRLNYLPHLLLLVLLLLLV
jgi:hypothetical protein